MRGISWPLEKLGSVAMTGWMIAPDEIRPFLFAPFALTDDLDSAIQDESVIKGLGTIRLDFYRARYHGWSDRFEKSRELTEKLVSPYQ